MTLEQNISEIIEKKMSDGTIEKIIEEKLTKAIDDSVGDIFKWGDGAKAIKDKLKDVMIPVIENHSFNNYALKLDTVLTDIINNTSLVDNKHILENFKELMIEQEMKHVKLSDIFNKYKEYVAKNVDTDGLEANCEDSEPYYENVEINMTTDIETEKYFRSSSENATVTFSCEHDKNDELTYTLKLYKSKDKDDNKWDISGNRYNNHINISSLRYLSNFEIFLIKLDKAFVKIEMDVQDKSDEVEPNQKPEWDLV